MKNKAILTNSTDVDVYTCISPKKSKITPPKQKREAEISGNLLVLNIIWILNDFGYKICGKTSIFNHEKHPKLLVALKK